MKTVVRKVKYFGIKFVIVKDEKERFWGIEEQYISKDNKLLKELNGIEGRMSKTIKECMKKCMRDANIEYLKSQSIDGMVAVVMVATGKTEQEAKELLGE